MKKLLILCSLVLFSNLAFAASTATVCDNANDCKLLLHADGTDESQTFTDSALNKTVTANGNAQLDTTQKKFGTASGLFDGTGDFLSLADSADWDFGSGDFTIDAWVRFNVLPGVGEYATFVAQNDSMGAGSAFWFGAHTEAGPAYKVDFNYYVSGANLYAIAWVTPSVDTWYHLAVTRNGADLKIFVDGTQIGSTHNISTSAIASSSLKLGVGAEGDSGLYLINGLIDELRIVKGTAVWTSNFTAPSSAYTLPASRKRMILMS